MPEAPFQIPARRDVHQRTRDARDGPARHSAERCESPGRSRRVWSAGQAGLLVRRRSPPRRARVGRPRYRASVLAQHEASREDGNDIVLRSSVVALRVTIGR